MEIAGSRCSNGGVSFIYIFHSSQPKCSADEGLPEPTAWYRKREVATSTRLSWAF